MSTSPGDVQTKLDAAVSELLKTTSSGAKMVSQYGSDPTRWPTGHWHNAMVGIAAARAEVGLLYAPPKPPTISFKLARTAVTFAITVSA